MRGNDHDGTIVPVYTAYYSSVGVQDGYSRMAM